MKSMTRPGVTAPGAFRARGTATGGPGGGSETRTGWRVSKKGADDEKG